MTTDTDRIEFLEQQARKSRTGISLDWVPSFEGEPSGFRFMRRHHIGPACKGVRAAIDRAMPGEDRLPAARCDACDNGIDLDWKFCAWCGALASAEEACGK